MRILVNLFRLKKKKKQLYFVMLKGCHSHEREFKELFLIMSQIIINKKNSVTNMNVIMCELFHLCLFPSLK